MQSGDAPDLPPRPGGNTKSPSPPPSAPSPVGVDIGEQARIIKQYEEQQAALVARREEDERNRREQEMRQQREFEELQRQQAERERMAQEDLMRNQQQMVQSQAAMQANEMQQQLLQMRGQYERDQLLLEQYDRVRSSDLDFTMHGVLTIRIEGESFGRRVARHICHRRVSDQLQGRPDQAATRPSCSLAQQI